MLRDSVECVTGVIKHIDPVMVSEQQANKEFSSDPSDLPGGSNLPVHTAEVLWQVKESELEKGGWVGGDAWFGSVHSAVSAWKKFGVHSTWIIKNNSTYFLKNLLPLS